MEKPNEAIDWTLIRSFAAVMREGNLSRAAAGLGLTQPTLGRHIRELERRAGETLFARKANRLAPTPAALSFIGRAQEIDAAVTALGRAMRQAPEEAKGTVRITASGILGVELLPGLMPDLLRAEPGLDVELIARDGVDNLLRRDADIAIRHVRPGQGDLIAVKLGEIGVGLYASANYLRAAGRPRTLGELAGHLLVVDESAAEAQSFARAQGLNLSMSAFRLRTDSHQARMNAMRAGAGVTACHHWLAAGWPDVERVLPALEVARLPVFLVAHDDLRRSRRLRAVFDFLSERVKAALGCERGRTADG